jgi:serine/threonine protein kinase
VNSVSGVLSRTSRNSNTLLSNSPSISAAVPGTVGLKPNRVLERRRGHTADSQSLLVCLSALRYVCNMSDVPEALRSALARWYRMERVIGHGGMATVYQARDLKHGRDVAVKVLRPDLAALIGTERFLREIEIGAQLNHPHILTLIDSGEAADFLYFVMPFIAGESLRGRLNRRRCLGMHEAVAIAAEVADALSYAHRKGVVHRDIKPENILLSEGHAVVTDFGIAKAVITAGTENLTRSGFPLGTLGYMSPEQAAGRTDLDQSTDIYSLACVVYEMLVGETPGMWPSDTAVALLHFVDALPNHRERLSQLPAAVEQALVKAMAPRPEQRYATPNDFAQALNRSLQSKTRYGDERVREIVRQAAEIQAREPGSDEDMSLAGVQRLAAEVGIEPDQVREALDRLEGTATGLVSGGIMGLRPQLELERFVDCEVDQVVYADLLEEIRVSLGEIGQMNETLGTPLSWSSSPKATGRKAQILVSPKSGRTRIRVVDNESTPSAVIMIPITLFSLISIGITGAIVSGLGASTLPTAIAALATSGSIFSAAYWAARRSFKRDMRQRWEVLAGLMERLVELVMQHRQNAVPPLQSETEDVTPAG